MCHPVFLLSALQSAEDLFSVSSFQALVQLRHNLISSHQLHLSIIGYSMLDHCEVKQPQSISEQTSRQGRYHFSPQLQQIVSNK